MADWTGSSPHAVKLIAALEDSIATAKVEFSICGWQITPYYLSRVAAAVREGKIGVEEWTAGTAYYDPGYAPRPGASPKDEENMFYVSFPTGGRPHIVGDPLYVEAPYFTTATKEFVNNRALVIHEAVHAIHDMFNRPITVLDDEASAYIAQAIYCLDNSNEYRERWKDWRNNGDMCVEACPLALRVLEGVSNPDVRCRNDYTELKYKISRRPKYQKFDWKDKSGYNGIGGFTPGEPPYCPGGLYGS